MNRADILQAVEQYADENLNKKIFVPGKSPVPASGPLLYPEDITALTDAVLDFWYTDWKHCAEFKRKLCEFAGKKHCVLVNSGSSASLIAMTALCKRTNKKFVVTTALGFPTTVYPIYQNGKIPIFVDVDPMTLEPDWDQVNRVWRNYTDDISGFVFAHTLGFPFNELRVPKVPHSFYNRPFFIADCCDALGSRFEEDLDPLDDDIVHVGTHSDVMTLSFFPAHHITSMEGGAILTDDDKLADEMERLVNWGRGCFCKPGQSNTCGHRFEPEHFGHDSLPEGWDHKYTFTDLGYNLKMTELQAALGASQMDHINDFVEMRRNNYYYLLEALDYLSDVLLFVNQPEGYVSPFGFPIIVKKGSQYTANDLIAYLEKNKIATRRIFGGNLIRQPAFSGLQYIHTDLSNTDYVMENGFWIGCMPSLTQDHLAYVVEVFKQYFL